MCEDVPWDWLNKESTDERQELNDNDLGGK